MSSVTKRFVEIRKSNTMKLQADVCIGIATSEESLTEPTHAFAMIQQFIP